MDKVTYISLFNKKAYKYYYKFHLFRKTKSVYFTILLSLLVVYLAINQTIAQKEFNSGIIFIWAIAAFTFLMIPFMTFTRMRNDLRKDELERNGANEIIEITKAKIERKIEGKGQKLVFGWNALDYIYESKECFLFYVDPYSAAVISKEALTNDDITTLRKLIMNNAPKTKKGKIKYKKLYKEVK